MFAKANIKPYEWIYFALLLVLACIQLIIKVVTETGGFTSRYTGFVAVSLLFFAFLGNRIRTPLLFRWFWLICFWLLVCITVVAFLFSIYSISVNDAGSDFMSGALFVIPLLLIPGLWHMYLYVWDNKALWKKTDTKKPVA